MALILLLVAIGFLTSPTQAGCPSKCNCTENSVACISKMLEYVPYFETLPNTPVIIDLSGNLIFLIHRDDFGFEKANQVKEIYMNNSNINTIEENAFDELENLQELYLAGNLLNELPLNLIIKNENLMLLDISRNLFVDMPKITSKSLEVLALANAGIETIPKDSLRDLPNLRILLLQQNNLKYIQPAIFDSMDHLFFVKLSYNPWSCTCKTIRLFNYLMLKSFIDLTEPVQCLDNDKNFINIYEQNGVTSHFKNDCMDDSDIWEKEQLLPGLSKERPYSLVKANGTSTPQEPQLEITFDLIYYSLVFIAIPLSFLMGVILGSCVTHRYNLLSLKRLQAESSKELLEKV